MAIGRSFHESLQKALRGLETGLIGLDGVKALHGAPRAEIEEALARPTLDRLLVAAQAMREGLGVEEIHAITRYDPGSSSGSGRSSTSRRRSAATACRATPRACGG